MNSESQALLTFGELRDQLHISAPLTPRSLAANNAVIPSCGGGGDQWMNETLIKKLSHVWTLSLCTSPLQLVNEEHDVSLFKGCRWRSTLEVTSKNKLNIGDITQKYTEGTIVQ